MSTAGADDPPPSFESVQDDPYVILGVEATATDDEIKSAYKKLCLKWHPDKNQGDADAEVMFQKVQSAWGILSSPELRAKYDSGGMEALEGNALNENGIQVDISQTGFMGSTLLAMFRKLGHPIKTVVSPSVLEAVKTPSALQTSPLQWGVPATGRVGNGQAIFYVLDIAPEHLEQGFVVVASCVHARVKLLLWDLDGDGDWSLAAQEDAVKVGQANATALYATTAELLEGVPRSVQAHVQAAAMVDRAQQDPFAHIFRVLDAAKIKDRLTLKPGQHLLAVYGDNFFKKSQFTLSAMLMEEGAARDDVAATEREIIDKRAELLAFEREFKRTRQEFETAVSKLESYTQALDTLFLKREVEYAGLLGLPAPAAAPATSASGALPEDGEGATADEATSAPLSPGLATPVDGRSGPLGSGSGALPGSLSGAGGSSSSFVTEQAKNIRNAASQASTQISGAFRGLFSKGDRKDPGWSSTDTPTAPAPAEAEPAAAAAPEATAPPVTSRARSFFRAFSRTSQSGTVSPESTQAVPVAGDGAASKTAADPAVVEDGVIATPLPGVAEAAGEAEAGGTGVPAGLEAPLAGSTEASASLSGALFVSGLPNADSNPNTPGAAAAAAAAAAGVDAGDVPAAAAGAIDAAAVNAAADTAMEAAAAGEASAAGETLPAVDINVGADAELPANDGSPAGSFPAAANVGEADIPAAGANAATVAAPVDPADTPDAAPADAADVVPMATSDAAPAGALDVVPGGPSDGVSGDIPDVVAGDTPDAAPADALDVVPSGTPDIGLGDTPDVAAGNTPDAAPADGDGAAADAPDAVPAGAAEAAPADTADEVPAEASDAAVASQGPPAEVETEAPPSAHDDTPAAAAEVAPAGTPAGSGTVAAGDSVAEAAAAAESPVVVGSPEPSFADAPEPEDSAPSPAPESSQSSFVRRMQERFSKAAQQ